MARSTTNEKSYQLKMLGYIFKAGYLNERESERERERERERESGGEREIHNYTH